MCVPAIALLAWFTFWVAALQITIRYIPSWAVFGTGVNQSNPSHLLNYVLIFSEPLSTAGYHPILYTFSCKNEPFLPFKSIFYGAPCNSFASLIATSKPARKAPPPPSSSFNHSSAASSPDLAPRPLCPFFIELHDEPANLQGSDREVPPLGWALTQCICIFRCRFSLSSYPLVCLPASRLPFTFTYL